MLCLKHGRSSMFPDVRPSATQPHSHRVRRYAMSTCSLTGFPRFRYSVA